MSTAHGFCLTPLTRGQYLSKCRRPDNLHIIEICIHTIGHWKGESTIAENWMKYFLSTDAESCTLGKIRLKVGEVLNNECEDRCTCQPTGELQCEPICNQYQKSPPEGAHVACQNQTSPDGCCTYVQCSPPMLAIGTMKVSSLAKIHLMLQNSKFYNLTKHILGKYIYFFNFSRQKQYS